MWRQKSIISQQNLHMVVTSFMNDHLSKSIDNQMFSSTKKLAKSIQRRTGSCRRKTLDERKKLFFSREVVNFPKALTRHCQLLVLAPPPLFFLGLTPSKAKIPFRSSHISHLDISSNIETYTCTRVKNWRQGLNPI